MHGNPRVAGLRSHLATSHGKRDEVLEKCRYYDESFEDHQRVSITVETQNAHISDEDIQYLNDHSDTQCPFFAPADYDIVVSERIKELTADPKRFLLNEHDSSMHRAIVATIRVPGRPHQRTAESNAKQNARRRKNKRDKAKQRKRQGAQADQTDEEEEDC